MKKLILAIDFDGVIHDYKNPVEGKRMGQPIEGTKNKLATFRMLGYTIIVHSLWGDKNGIIGEWMKYYGIPYDEITNIKPNADYYIDDRAIKFASWKEIKI
jgi:hypothetical protein